MDWKKLIINAALAAFWVGLATFQATGEFTKSAALAAGAAAVRAFIGFILDAVNKPVPVDV